ncbi:MAG: sigma-70 family RNA polymerase sigma factor [Verrucomicrobiota bacterium]|jgi:RNA polymerase sigma-70 factor (ECF subfamily)|nr:sigma-70 family RNA polymerase sigma factor [Verrucomicrobiota bacterium]MEC8864890.1 sigma-70 family RNA polymerase sigma factor [Verrucomicrobiota bacterium]|tara:strand:- start:500 stop:1078 length:579 start_codon:yes stop_codon:yes gene_type:complete
MFGQIITMPRIENEIWTRIKEGDSAAFAELYDGFASAMFSLSLQILNDRWEAEEVIQDVFSYLWRKPDSYSPSKGKFSSWLLVITRNRSIDRYRSRKRRLDRGQSDEVLNQKEDFSQTDGAEEATLNDERKQLRVAFRLLPPDQRQVLELSYFKGFNHKEISEKLDLSLGTVKSRIRLGVEKLRNSLSTLRL